MVGIFIFFKVPGRSTPTSANLYYDKDSGRKKKMGGGRGTYILVWFGLFFGGFTVKTNG